MGSKWEGEWEWEWESEKECESFLGRRKEEGQAKAGWKYELVYSGVDITAATRVFYVHLST